ncbi:NAD-dependent protein deacetylase sirtuin-1 [Kappamyces sp. JEL0680]|nr:NAD-dependent protein deacetylase sirtuin-1 [Kappamyces sp. JEL0680]
MKPDIIFFGENLPQDFHDKFAKDKHVVDLLIVMGSSLRVAPVATVKDRIPHRVPQILINMESLRHMQEFDIQLLGYSDTVTKALARSLGWDESNQPGFDPSQEPPAMVGKRLPGTIVGDLSCKKGLLDWQWLFEGAIDQKVVIESSEEEEIESLVSEEDSNTIDSVDGESDRDDLGDNNGFPEQGFLATIEGAAKENSGDAQEIELQNP